MLPLAALVLLGGAMGDRFGRRRIFLAGVVIFAAGCAACAAAPSLAWLLIAVAFAGLAFDHATATIPVHQFKIAALICGDVAALAGLFGVLMVQERKA